MSRRLMDRTPKSGAAQVTAAAREEELRPGRPQTAGPNPAAVDRLSHGAVSHDFGRLPVHANEERSAAVAQAKSDGAVRFGVPLAPGGAGTALPEGVRGKMESALEADFSGVEVHQDGQAERIGAQAFTVGDRLHFARDRYDPDSEQGQALIGHELAHVVQQRSGRVDAGPTQGGATVVQDPALETEADALGSHAATSPELVGTAPTAGGGEHAARPPAAAGRQNAVAQQSPVVQMTPIAPVAAAIWAKLTTDSAVAAAATVGTILSAGSAAASAGSALAPGQTGVQSVTMENGWMSDTDQLDLQLLTQYKIINAYVAQWQLENPGVPLVPPAPEPSAAGTTPAPAPAPAPATPAPVPGVAPGAAEPPRIDESGGGLDAAIMEVTKTNIERELKQTLNDNEQVADNKEYIWSDSGDHTADTIGTVGAIEFVNVTGTYISETARLSPDAKKIPALKALDRSHEINVRQFRGGEMRRSPLMSAGWGDALAINLVGTGPHISQSEMSDHGSHTYSTEWNWDDKATYGDFELWIGSEGKPGWADPKWEGTPDDFSLW